MSEIENIVRKYFNVDPALFGPDAASKYDAQVVSLVAELEAREAQASAKAATEARREQTAYILSCLDELESTDDDLGYDDAYQLIKKIHAALTNGDTNANQH